ncbi:hypothetical protein BDV96DRAFT_322446 [Lophiotrema nucula]|uniref:Uncharacterized protein n=1 Tax=Lophiotrema nucula TaxID=690887 RepID=A0A6A5ZMN2_9PLEO|nr:hypothetical protein BDV96DRAFT_322446 [Lophiotrema nucula]
MASKPTYFEMPNFDTPPDSLVRLGQVIYDFEDPTTVVAPPLSFKDSSQVHTSFQTNWESRKTESTSASVGVWTQFLASLLGIGADASLLLERERSNVFILDRLDTSFFEPNLDYARAAMASPEAISFYEQNPRKPAFIVTGIKIARGAAVEQLKRLKYEIQGNAGINLTAVTGAPVTVGPKGSLGRTTTSSTGFSGSSDFVFAYRLKKISKNRSHTVSKITNHIKGAVHDVDLDDFEGKERIPREATKREATNTQLAFEVTGLQVEDFEPDMLYTNYTVVEVGEVIDNSKKENVRVVIKGAK